ncbi:MAG TPA: isoaspartyl peptidase/L-asparaginase, partial [Kofleriaceae bacterium]|nr:isoaspartyl peptidase/L-asparaginase [Kofleriaceae bacterium]
DAGERTPRRAKQPPPTPWVPAAIAHCGPGTPPDGGGGCEPAIAAALAVLEKGGDPLDAATAGVVVLEDDPRHDAGSGPAARRDGRAVEMDASVMDSSGKFGAAVGLEQVENPVRVARAIADTPDRILAGQGATAFARALGQARVDAPGGQTVGVAVRTADGRFAAALSSGGSTAVVRGRVGEVPVPGAGLYAGPFGAIAATGRGELIIDEQLARTVHGWLAEGATASEAAERGVELLDGEAALIVITATDAAAAARPPMAWCTRALGTGVR